MSEVSQEADRPMTWLDPAHVALLEIVRGRPHHFGLAHAIPVCVHERRRQQTHVYIGTAHPIMVCTQKAAGTQEVPFSGRCLAILVLHSLLCTQQQRPLQPQTRGSLVTAVHPTSSSPQAEGYCHCWVWSRLGSTRITGQWLENGTLGRPSR